MIEHEKGNKLEPCFVHRKMGRIDNFFSTNVHFPILGNLESTKLESRDSNGELTTKYHFINNPVAITTTTPLNTN